MHVDNIGPADHTRYCSCVNPFENPTAYLKAGSVITGIGVTFSIVLPLALKALGFSAGAIATASAGSGLLFTVGLITIGIGVIGGVAKVSAIAMPFISDCLQAFYSRY